MDDNRQKLSNSPLSSKLISADFAAINKKDLHIWHRFITDISKNINRIATLFKTVSNRMATLVEAVV